jgi:putative FmdB family regulatory protein
MATYTYQCVKCDHEQDEKHGMNESPQIQCVKCGHSETKRIITTSQGFSLKGTGWYVTDFKGES